MGYNKYLMTDIRLEKFRKSMGVLISRPKNPLDDLKEILKKLPPPLSKSQTFYGHIEVLHIPKIKLLRAMNPKYKLIYFNARGRAEHIRFIFAYAGVDYVDERISQEQWAEYKKKMPFGMVPVLEVDGKIICQSNAIARYLARKYNLAGKDEWESLQCDVLVDTLSDVKQALMQFRTECDPLKKEEKKVILMKETIPFYMGKFEAILNANNGFSVGESVTWADFVFASSLENFECIFGKNALDRYAGLKALKDKVFNLPGIKEWITRRPVTEF